MVECHVVASVLSVVPPRAKKDQRWQSVVERMVVVFIPH
jgi:hypothetical protein